MSEKVEIYLGVSKVGEIDCEMFELVKMYITDGKNVKEVVEELKQYGITTSLAVNAVLTARRQLRQSVSAEAQK
ncbi:MAG: hypothetical protein Q7S12_04895 [bacterium]|nr:hypothetical protein [bacterium]